MLYDFWVFSFYDVRNDIFIKKIFHNCSRFESRLKSSSSGSSISKSGTEPNRSKNPAGYVELMSWILEETIFESSEHG